MRRIPRWVWVAGGLGVAWWVFRRAGAAAQAAMAAPGGPGPTGQQPTPITQPPLVQHSPGA